MSSTSINKLYRPRQASSAYLGKNNKVFVYCRLINRATLYLLTTMLNFYLFAFDPPMQNTINVCYSIHIHTITGKFMSLLAHTFRYITYVR